MRDNNPPIEPDPVIEVYKKNVDITLIRENLKLSVEDRLRKLMRMQKMIDELRRARNVKQREKPSNDRL